ncbi:TIGR02285 family protein [Pseudomonas reactans]|uniref:TIGR02285 family protein n=1 Tax=Pseudomonas reactans TaxID=117680 RepID=A0ABX2QWN8_9PSED|nr:TIGR02285 family protein [Pseudomonas reactans]NWA36108.1 TIGR02285 family protein [Pseudomonas reactans]NWC84434.1 TIGR02285 family protein [Pseudomonas reactans]NWD28726.1 TIGR02285 family protein [Pseudomonas reactans]NWD95254.1 TIGR02285 family protein [Pseudomonas reactans]NWF17286.1 TIGR02285 family protein [Pseudomonas reactans]
MVRRLAQLCLSVMLAWGSTANAEDTLVWLLRDLPPLTIFEGPRKGQGALDQLLPILIEHLPEYRHQVLHVNRARGMQMLREPTFTCDPSLLWTAERAKYVVFSSQAFVVASNGITIRRDTQEGLAAYIREGQFDLQAFFDAHRARVGAVAERSYGPVIDERLKHADAHKLALHYGNDALGSLLQMQRLGRLEAVLGYWPEIRYHAMQQGIASDDLVFYPIKDSAPYQRIHIGCSDTPQGHLAIERINQALHDLPLEQVQQSYASWLDPVMREQYLRDNPNFFRDSPEP